MPIERSDAACYWLAVWTAVSLVGLTVLGAFALDLYVVAVVTGLVALRGSVPETPATRAWRRRLTHVTLVGLVAFAAVVGRRVVTSMPAELV